MRFFSFFSLMIAFGFTACNPMPENTAQLSTESDTPSIHEVIRFFTENSGDSAKITQYWDELKSAQQIPYKKRDSVLFLYKGTATSVAWHGDFNGWSSNRNMNTSGTKIAGTDIFYWKTSFPADARLDYKIVIGSNWILDPNNPFQQWSGFGPNSELRMPDYQPSPYKTLQNGVKAGNLSGNQSFFSSSLGYRINYRVWTPADYDTTRSEPYKVLFITDGHEYADSRLGATPQVAANLMHEKLIEPIVMVFVSPLNPSNSNENRRQNEYVLNAAYSNYLKNELIPKIETDYHVSTTRNDRGILGTSLGGLHSAYVMSTIPDVFGRIGIHSPAFWYREQIFTLVSNLITAPDRIFMSTGTIGDTETEADRMQQIFDTKGWKYEYIKVNEGHSWGNWSGLMDETLIYLYGTVNTSIER